MKLHRVITQFIAATGIITALALAPAVLTAAPAHAAACDANNPSLESGIACSTPTGVSQKGLFSDPNGSLFKTIADTLILVIGAISVLMIIIGGLRYVLSAGQPQATAGAKDTILYAVVGVVVAILAFGIVQFVVTQINK